LADVGFDVVERHIDYDDVLDLDALVGGRLSAFPVDELPPPGLRHEFAARIGRALASETRFIEHVRVSMLLGRTTSAPRSASREPGVARRKLLTASDDTEERTQRMSWTARFRAKQAGAECPRRPMRAYSRAHPRRSDRTSDPGP
jgi:hypothetical protein